MCELDWRQEGDEQVKMDRKRSESSEAGERVGDHGAVSCGASKDVGDGSRSLSGVVLGA